jgi:hypothetical protein
VPFTFEPSDKASHADIVTNPEVAQFLGKCVYAKIPSDEQAEALAGTFGVVPVLAEELLPQKIMAVDGSFYSAPIHPRMLPSSTVSYLKISCLLILLDDFRNLRIEASELIDPFRMARLRDRNDALIFALPGSNVLWNGAATLRDGFRAAIDAHFLSPQTRQEKADYRTSLRTTLFHIVAHGDGGDPAHPDRIVIARCPYATCIERDVVVHDVLEDQYCPSCKGVVYPTDYLRLWEGVSEEGSTAEIVTRLMSTIEHMTPIHYLRYLREKQSFEAIASVAVFMDGPLALFGQPAKLHSGILGYYFRLNAELEQRRLQHIIVIGLQKTGVVVDFFATFASHIPKSRILPVSDDFRFHHLNGPDPAADPADRFGHGFETYYGQDFLFKSRNGGSFVVSVPYPFPSKSAAQQITGTPFKIAKSEYQHYGSDLTRALALVERFETSVYPNALIPVALAHKFTAISLVPGGRVLSILTERTLRGTLSQPSNGS